jgi:hypothetical protein
VAAINLAVGVTVIGLISGFGQSVLSQQRSGPGPGQQPPAAPYQDPYREQRRDPYRDTYRDPYRR